MGAAGRQNSRFSARVALAQFAFVAAVTLLFPSWGRAGTWLPFGPKTYTRGPGDLVTVTNTFTLLNPAAQYTLKAFNGANSSGFVPYCVVMLNGVQIIGTGSFKVDVHEFDIPITPSAFNTISVQVRGKLGVVLALEIVGVDNDRPVISAAVNPPPNPAGWNNSAVTVSFTCSDKTSGVASCPAPITIGTEGANQAVSGTATDFAGNTASTSVTINLDMTPPTISASANPPPDASGWNNSAVTVTFTCADALSGVAFCSPPVAITTETTGQLVPGTATDVAGNSATTSVTVRISFNFFLVRSWQVGPNGNAASPSGKCLDYGGPWPGTGANVFLNDCSQAHPIRVAEFGPRLGSGGTMLYHDVLLFAGRNVIGLNNPPAINLPGAPPPSGPSSTDFTLELQPYNPALGSTRNQIFRLDGDSIIWEGTSVDPVTGVTVAGPCLNTDASLCPNGPAPQLVFKIQNARGANGSPIVAGPRELSDNEFWDFNATNGSGKFPTLGFMPVATSSDLVNAASSALWGTVIVVAPASTLDLSIDPVVLLAAGVTLRGGRRGILPGPQLYFSYQSWQNQGSPNRGGLCNSDTCMLEVRGDYVRVTGLSLRGESLAVDTSEAKTIGIQVDYPASQADPSSPFFNLATSTSFIATIDHNEGSQWGESPVEGKPIFSYDPNHQSNKCTYPAYIDPTTGLQGSYPCDQNTTSVPYPSPSAFQVPILQDPAFGAAQPGTLANIHIARNFLHHNKRDDGGYGASVRGRSLIEGNTFVWNRHDISADAEPHNEFHALNNLILSSTYTGYTPIYGRLQDFDMHGTDNARFCAFLGLGCFDAFFGGAAGYYVEIDGNTFLGTDGHDYLLRGQPGFNTDYFHNVSLRKQGDAVQWANCVPFTICFGTGFPINISNSQFADSSPPYTDPTIRFGPTSLGVGDFDGDAVDDLFLATGVGWYFAPGGKAEWRFLNRAPDTIDQLLFGDFDGDGRTDVVAMRNGQLVVSWGGISAFDPLNANPPANCTMADMAVGDFDGDGVPDIFCADGGTWWISYGGNTPFVQVIVASPLRVSDLRFGDFNGDGTTDVFGVVNGTWMVRYAPKGVRGLIYPWQSLPVSLTNTVNSLLVADFNGDGIADVLSSSSDGWQISYGGAQPWTDVPQLSFGGPAFSSVAGVGHFTGQRQADVLVWDNTLYNLQVTGLTKDLLLSAAGVSPATPYSTQDMR